MKVKNTRKWYDYYINLLDTKIATFEVKDLNEIENEVDNILSGSNRFKDYYSDIGYGILAPKESKLVLKQKENNKLRYIFELWNKHLLTSEFEVIE